MTDRSYTGPIWRKGKLVLLCPVHQDDIPFHQQWINEPTNNVFLSRTHPNSMPEQQQWFDRVTSGDSTRIVVSIRTHGGELIGNMSLEIDPIRQTARTGSLIGHPGYKGQGYGTDAKMLLLEYAFNWRNVRRAISTIIGFNRRSQAYARKCGYRHMATIEQEHFRHGQWHDEVQYVVFRDEWLPLWEQHQDEVPYYEEIKQLFGDSTP